jgi:hypothetical protein
MRRKQVQCNFVSAQARIEHRISVLKRDFEAERVAVMLDTLCYVADDEYGRGTYHHRMFCSHRTLRACQDYYISNFAPYGTSRQAAAL